MCVVGWPGSAHGVRSYSSDERLHAFHAHNLLLWLAELAPALLLARGRSAQHRYWLQPDGDDPDWLIGGSLDGDERIEVHVPTNDVIRRPGSVPTLREALERLGWDPREALAPPRSFGSLTPQSLSLEEADAELNPEVRPTIRSRDDVQAGLGL